MATLSIHSRRLFQAAIIAGLMLGGLIPASPNAEAAEKPCCRAGATCCGLPCCEAGLPGPEQPPAELPKRTDDRIGDVKSTWSASSSLDLVPIPTPLLLDSGGATNAGQLTLTALRIRLQI